MEANFWKQKWERREIAFHEGEANYFLTKHFNKLNLAQNSRVFVPLCGKTRDIAWLLNRGYQVAGAELSEIAVKELFQELGLDPSIKQLGKLVQYCAKNIDIYVGDIFDITADALGAIHGIYDRAALVALPDPLREQYTSHLMSITNAATQLLVCYEYDQQSIDGPPFSIKEDEVRKHYGEAYVLQTIETRNVLGGMKGKVPSFEAAWMLLKK